MHISEIYKYIHIVFDVIGQFQGGIDIIEVTHMFKLDGKKMENDAVAFINQIGTFNDKDMEIIKKMLSPSITVIDYSKKSVIAKYT